MPRDGSMKTTRVVRKTTDGMTRVRTPLGVEGGVVVTAGVELGTED